MDVGDLTYLRIVTDANPSGGDWLEESPRVRRGNCKQVKADPVVVLRLDITHLANLLKTA